MTGGYVRSPTFGAHHAGYPNVIHKRFKRRPTAKWRENARNGRGACPDALSPLRPLSHPAERGSGIKSNRLSEIQELQDAHTVLASLDGAHERLTARDPVGHHLLAQTGPLATFLQQATQDFMPR